jgi:2-polyprenyl-6-methoxyphenol hydroxylase-like FAD-dependent oxidoreductase
MEKNIDIIGAGIGGLTLALLLQRKHFNFTLFESASQLKPVGSGIILAYNAMNIFKELHLLDKLQKEGNRISYLKITDPQLNTLSVIDVSVFEQKYKVPTVAIQRGELHKILSAEIDLKNIMFSKRLSRVYKKESNAYELEFEDQSKQNSHTIIGADGIHSVVRDQVFGKGILRRPGQICWRGVTTFNLPEKYHNELNEAWGKGKRFGFVKVSENKVYWYALVNDKNKKILFEDVKELFENFHPVVMEIIHSTAKEKIIMTEIMDLRPIPRWQNGNVYLLGDAAHAMTPNLGQGACQAIEDAYLLGNLFNKNKGVDVQELFRKFETDRIKKVKMLVDKSWKIGKMAHMENQLAIWLRNKMMKAMPDSLNKKQMNKIYAIDPPGFSL